MKRIFKLSLTVILATLIMIPSFAQDDEEKEKKKKDKPIRSPFTSTLLIDNQTTVNPRKGGLEFLIYHRMSGMDNGITDLYGFYGAANIHLTLQYGVTEKLMVGFGTEKYSKMQEFYWKYAIFTQTRKGTIPVSLSYFGNAVIDARDTSNFGNNYTFFNRFSYFHQLIVSRKFNGNLSAQLAFSYSHFNAVEEGWHNDILGAALSGKYRVYNDISAIYEFHYPIELRDSANQSKPNLAIGFEIGTYTHAFQLFVSSYDQIIPQKNYVFNKNDLFNIEGADDPTPGANIGIGFNVHVKF